jgi:tetratricopeptide (TPR) repeat protein
MIVKNESRVIKRLLESVYKWIDCYCICDTGSTDDTIEIIESFFKEHNIPGTIVHEAFQDFGYNRTFALKACESLEQNPDFILLLDADMMFWVNPQLSKEDFKQSLTLADAHYMYQGSEQFFYKNVRIVRNNFGISYWGVTHEYVKTPPNTIYSTLEKNNVFIQDIGDGGAKSDKFERDIRLLKKGIEEFPDNDRYHFYLANSYKDSGDYVNAIDTYKKRIQLGGWHEEIWYSYYAIGLCYKLKGDMGKAIHAWMDAYQFFPERLENLYEIIHFYRCEGKNRLAYPFCRLAKVELDQNRKLDFLFMQKDVYDYKLDYELSIIGYYCNTDKYDLERVSMRVLKYPYLDEGICRNVLSNYKFYSNSISSWDNGKMSHFAKVAKTVGKELMKPWKEEFVSSTPSILSIDNGSSFLISVRYVNYRIGENGEYINQDQIITKNVLAKLVQDENGFWDKESEIFLSYDTSHDNRYVGLEDVRLFLDNNKIYYSANRGIENRMVVEAGAIDLDSGKTVDSVFLTMNRQREIEKNWVYFQGENQKKMVYGWHPLIIGNIEGSQFVNTHEFETPAFFRHVRNSTNGIYVKDPVFGEEIWFIGHIVSYEDRRYYYHIFIVLDKNTLALKKYTNLFTFEKEKVEYTLGFTYNETTDSFLIGYSTMDNTTKFINIDRSKITTLMI